MPVLRGLLLISCLVLAPLVVQAQEYVLRFSFPYSLESPQGQGALLFKRLAEERLPEGLRIELLPNSTLLRDNNGLPALRNGDAQIIALPLARLERTHPRLQVFELPFAFRDLEAVHRLQQSESGRQLLELREQGYRGLGFWDQDPVLLISNRPLRAANDWQGLRVRAPSGEISETYYRALGAVIQRNLSTDLHTALQNGVIDGAEVRWSEVREQQLAEDSRYLLDSPWLYHGLILLANNSFWEQLPEEMRTVLERTLSEVAIEVNRSVQQYSERERLAVLSSHLGELITLNADEREALRRLSDLALRPQRERIGVDLLDSAAATGARP